MAALLLCLTTVISASLAYECPSSVPGGDYTKIFVPESGEDTPYCYRFHLNEEKEFNNAQQVCYETGGNLAMPKTFRQQNFLKTNLIEFEHHSNVWIGLHDKRNEDHFEWVDGTDLKTGDDYYQNWGHHQGSSGNIPSFLEDCVVINPRDDFQWHDYHCQDEFILEYSFAFICQYDVEGSRYDFVTDKWTTKTGPTVEYTTEPWAEPADQPTQSGTTQWVEPAGPTKWVEPAESDPPSTAAPQQESTTQIASP